MTNWQCVCIAKTLSSNITQAVDTDITLLAWTEKIFGSCLQTFFAVKGMNYRSAFSYHLVVAEHILKQ